MVSYAKVLQIHMYKYIYTHPRHALITNGGGYIETNNIHDCVIQGLEKRIPHIYG